MPCRSASCAASRNRTCPLPWTARDVGTTSYPFGYCYLPAIQPPQAPQCAQCVGNPIDPAYGNKTQRETDYAGGTANLLRFDRTYNFMGTFFGPGQPTGRTSCGTGLTVFENADGPASGAWNRMRGRRLQDGVAMALMFSRRGFQPALRFNQR